MGRAQEAKKKQAEEAANVKLDKVLAAFRLVKNNKFAELEDLLLEGACQGRGAGGLPCVPTVV